jgi:hypothetical protein
MGNERSEWNIFMCRKVHFIDLILLSIPKCLGFQHKWNTLLKLYLFSKLTWYFSSKVMHSHGKQAHFKEYFVFHTQAFSQKLVLRATFNIQVLSKIQCTSFPHSVSPCLNLDIFTCLFYQHPGSFPTYPSLYFSLLFSLPPSLIFSDSYS